MKKLLFLCCMLPSFSFAQRSEDSVAYKYIEKYKDLAITEMQLYCIPASIILAQGMLESECGKSDLVTRSNNHFGIKHGGTWSGPIVYHNDDHKNEKFRKYDSVEASFRDHSIFLQKRRYTKLFELELTDYKGWAKGLKECGYATDRKYPEKLISIIERYKLHQFDTIKISIVDTTNQVTTASQ